jgi:hypothetical protein
MAAAVQRNAIEGELQRFTLRVARHTAAPHDELSPVANSSATG